jgi:ribosomal peptide maturation radical SAM protein 1
MKVALINMPFASFMYPSIGISLLQAELHRTEIPCDIYYLNLDLAARIGCLSYLALGVLSPMTSLTGEWLFAADLFGRDSRRDVAYIEDILKQGFAQHFRPRVVRRLLEVRECVSQFLDACLERVPWAGYDVVGFTSSFQQHVPSLALAKRVRKAFPGKTIVFGGANCEGEMGIESHRQFHFVDFVCSGEGDKAFPELIRRLASGDKAPDVAGIISRKGRETVVPREIVSPVFNLDGLPFPSYDDYFDQLQKLRLNRQFTTLIPYETSRGCWWGAKMHCTFCGLNGATMTYRSKTPARALDELLYLGKKYGRRFIGVDNILDLKYLDSFFPQLAARRLRFNLYFDTKVNLTKNQIKVLRDAGVRYLQPGIESLSTPILRLMNKGCNLLQNVQFLKWCRQLGVEVDWNFLYGFPDEPPSEYVEMAKFIPFLSHFDPPGGCGRIRTDRFSPYFTHPAEYGLANIRPIDAYRYIYPFEPEALARLAYYFDFRAPEERHLDAYARPAVEKVNAWRLARTRGQFKGIIEPDTLILVDTRTRRKRSTTVLEEPLRTAYIFCDQIRPFSAIQAHLSLCLPSPNCTDAWLEEALKDLVSRGLMLKDGKSYLSLAILPDYIPAIDSQAPVARRHQDIPPENLVQLDSDRTGLSRKRVSESLRAVTDSV